MKKLAIFASSAGALMLPLVAFAADPAAGTAQGVITNITGLVDSVIPLIVGLTVLVFFYGLFQYAWQQEEEVGKKTMIAGLIALFVMVSLWGLVKLVQSTVGVTNNDTSGITLPKVPTPQNTTSGSSNTTIQTGQQ